MSEALTQTFAESDFVPNANGYAQAEFTGSLPADALVLGVLFDVTALFEDSGNVMLVDTLAVYDRDPQIDPVGTITAGVMVAQMAVDTLGGRTSPAGGSPEIWADHPRPFVVPMANGGPVGFPVGAGSVTVSILYERPGAAGPTSSTAAAGGSEPIRADLEIFYGADRDLVFPITRDGVAVPVTAMGKAMRIRNVVGTLVVTKVGSNHPTETQTAVFPIVASDFGSAAGEIGVGQYSYAVVLTDAGRSFVATYGTLTVKRPAA